MPARREPGPASPLLQLLLPLLLPLLQLLLLAEMAVGQSRPPSPCPAFYSYEMGGNGEMVGLISMLTPPRYSEVRLVAKLSSPVPVQRNEVGELSIRGGREGAMQATRSVLAGRRHPLYYHLRFPPNRPTPTLLTITVNDYEICSNRNPPSNGRATITLQAFLNTGVSSAPKVDGHEFGAIQSNIPEPQFPSNRPEEPEELPPERPRPPPPEHAVLGSALWKNKLQDIIQEEYHLSKFISKSLHKLLDLENRRISLHQEILYWQKHLAL